MKYKTVELVSIAVGLYLVLEAVGSIMFLEGDPLFQMGRMIRIGIGAFLIYLGYSRMIK
jgi:hypothetical protein